MKKQVLKKVHLRSDWHCDGHPSSNHYSILDTASFNTHLTESNYEDNSGSDDDCKQEGPGNVEHDASYKNGHEIEKVEEDKGQNEN